MDRRPRTRRLREREPFEIDTLPAPPHTSVWRLVWQGIVTGVLIVVGLILLLAAGSMGAYAYYARSLPSPQELYDRASPFQSAKIFDRHGTLLFEFFDPTAGRRTVTRYEDIPAVMVAATVATEDASFFTNPGVNPLSIARALVQDVQEGELLFGGSTITQQVVKNLFLTQERTLSRKVKEAILATEITRRYSKEEILEVYLNEVYFGTLAYGVGAAAETYFGKAVSELELHEAALLAGLIQAPAYYDPYSAPDRALARREDVLYLMARRGYVTAAEAAEAAERPLGVVPTMAYVRAPHMVMYVRQLLEQLYGEERIYREGLQVYTTLDLDLQTRAEEAVGAHRETLSAQGANNAALVALNPASGDILAMVGSADFWDEAIAGQVNVAFSRRQPGSTIKPLTYLAALERGWTAGTMLMDVPQEFPDGANEPYRPVNYDGRFWGPVSMRTALGASRNIPAVSTLHQIGMSSLLEAAQRLGIRSLTRPDYGLSLTLGGGDVTLMEMTAAYGTLANGGRRTVPRAILYIRDAEGGYLLPPDVPEGPLVADPRHAHILTDILADPAARRGAFGAGSVLELAFPAAVKTGTTNDYHDSWTIGYTPDLVVGVWVGNSDNAPMDGVTGSRGAGPIWNAFMTSARAEAELTPFPRPEGLVEVEVCAVSGHLPTEGCPERRVELFTAETVPTEPCPVHVRLRVCTETGKLATEFCTAEGVEERAYEDFGPQWDSWAASQGKAIPPREVCDVHTSATRVTISVPPGRLSGVVEVRGSTEFPGFAGYVVELGRGAEPEFWEAVSPAITAPVRDGVLYRWDTRALEDGTYTLRVVVRSHDERRAEARVTAEVHNPYRN